MAYYTFHVTGSNPAALKARAQQSLDNMLAKQQRLGNKVHGSGIQFCGYQTIKLWIEVEENATSRADSTPHPPQTEQPGS